MIKAEPALFPVSFRLDEETVELIKAIAEKLGVSQRDVVRLGTRLLAKREGLKMPLKQPT